MFEQRPEGVVGAGASPRAVLNRSRSGSGFRLDIEGLRAVAVVSVVLYHPDPGAVPGGFIGVDVFFVISGFLITDLLWREVDGRRTVSLAGFYARRARRILPAAMLVLAVTMIASYALLPPLRLRSVWLDGLYCAFYAGNIRFAQTQTNYLAASAPSPFQHYWSLGVEEQFYLVWPLLILGASLVWWRRRPSRTAAVAWVVAVASLSFALSVWLTGYDEPLAFFLLPSRAWELGMGGAVALAAPRLRRLAPAWAGAAG